MQFSSPCLWNEEAEFQGKLARRICLDFILGVCVVRVAAWGTRNMETAFVNGRSFDENE